MNISIRISRRSLGAVSLLAFAAASYGQTAFYPSDTVLGPDTHVSFANAIVGYSNFDDYLNGANPTNPTVTVAGATFDLDLEVRNSSVVNMIDGTVGAFFGRILTADTSTFNMTGGTAQSANPQFDSVFNLFGGSVGSLQTNDNSRLNIFGGTIGGTLQIDGTGSVSVTGGTLGADVDPDFFPIAEIDTASTLTMIGRSDLSAAITDPNFEDFYTVYTLAGHLSDGTDVTGKRIFVENDGGGTLKIAAVPEPASILALGTFAVGALRRRRK